MVGQYGISAKTSDASFNKVEIAGRKALKTFFILLVATAFGICGVMAQSGKIPPFSMLQANGSTFTAQLLPKGKPVVLIYFSPECDHCQHLMNDLFKRVTEFNKASLVMVTYLSNETVKKFSTDYNVRKYPNIFVGTEGATIFLRNYYGIMNLPFTAMYDKNGNLIATFKDDVTVTELTRRLAMLK